MDTKTQAPKSTPVLKRPSEAQRLRTGLRAGYDDGGVTHTDRWDGEQIRRR